MLRAFVIVTIDPGKAKVIFAALRERVLITSVDLTYGGYEIVVQVIASDPGELETLVWSFLDIDGVKTTQLFIVSTRQLSADSTV